MLSARLPALALMTILAAAAFAADVAPIEDAALPEPPMMRPLRFAGDGLRLYATAPTRRLRAADDPEQLPGLAAGQRLAFAAARNETEQTLLWLRADAAGDVTLDFSTLTGPATIPGDAWRYEPVGFVPVDKPGKWYGIGHWETGMIPDPLLPPGGTVGAGPEATTGALITLAVPVDAPPGDYKGELRVQRGGRTLLTVPTALTVWPLVLPPTRALTTMLTEPGRTDADYAFLREKGVNSLKYGVVGPKVVVDRDKGEVKIDAADHLAATARVTGELGFHSITLPPSLLGGGANLNKNYLSTGHEVGSDAFWPVYRNYMRGMGEAYRGAGLADRVVFYIMDEIHAKHYPTLAAVAWEAKLAFPEIRTMAVVDKLSEDTERALDIWVVPWHFFVTGVDDPHYWDQARARGVELWAYMNSLYTINTEVALKDLRFYPAMLARYGYTGNLWWSINHYAGKDPWAGGIATLENAERKDRHYGNGYLFYPPRDSDPHWRSSLRWEAYQQGLDEYELMDQLKGEIAAAVRTLGPVADDGVFGPDTAMRGWGALLGGHFRLQSYRRDGEYIARFRQLLAHELAEMPKRPLLLVDVEPKEGMLTMARTLHVRGVAEAGARVYVAGQPVPVFDAEKAYVFWDETPLQPGVNTVPVTAVAADGTRKTVYREITVAEETQP